MTPADRLPATPIPAARSRWRAGLLGAVLLAALPAARADAVEALQHFVQDVRSGRAAYTQVVTSPDGAKKKSSSGSFEFLRPNRFRFDYAKPYEQQIVADGVKVWLYDVDLAQVTVRGFDQALGSTPASILAGGSLERDFNLKAEPEQGGLQWVQALPKAGQSQFRALRVGFKGQELAALEITDGFGQRSRLDFSRFEANAPIAPARFQFKAPAGVDVLQQ
ncbi:MAG: outer rane lipoprotein chaperone LolA [Pseudomonadota bacterium]|jgi:outer membrane lipoprotein carrier protein